MADNIPDFTVKTPAVNPEAFANVLQRKRQIENEQNQQALNNYNDKMKRISDAIMAGQTVANNALTLAEKRQTLADQRTASAGQAKVQQILTSPEPQAPTPTASSSMLPAAGTFPVQPSPEQTQSFEAQKAKRINDLKAALIQSDRKGVTDIYAKQMFNPEKPTMSLEPQDVMVDGVRTKAAFNKANLAYYDVNTRQPITGHITPIVPAAEDTEITDKDRAELTPLAKKLVEGSAKPGDLVNARGTRKEKVARIAAEIDPNFDLTTVAQRVAVRKDFAPGGKSSANLTSQNTIIGHLDTLDSAFNDLDNKAVTKENSVINYLKKNVGKPEVSKVIAAKAAVINEMGKQFQGSGVVSNDEREQFSKALNESSSPAQAHAVIDTWIDLMKSRSDALKANWNQTMPGIEPPTPFINDKSKKLLTKHGYDPVTLEKSGKGSAEDEANQFLQGFGK